jgi:hypothetical protein
VLPQFILRREANRGKAEETLSGENAAHAALFAERIEEALADSAQDRFQVVSNMLMRKAFDGISIRGKRREHPGNCRCWLLPKQYTSTLKGWYTGEGEKTEVEEFVTSQADNTVAAQQGFTAALGTITGVFYTVGVPPPGRPQSVAYGSRGEFYVWRWRYDFQRKQWDWHRDGPMAAAAEGGGMGTAAGQRQNVSLEHVRGDKPGLMLAALTIHYASPSQIEQMQKKKDRPW